MNPVKILCIAIFWILVGNYECSPQETLCTENQQWAVELKNAIENRDFQVITLTRPSNMQNMRFFLPREIDHLFRQLSSHFNAKMPEISTSFFGKFTDAIEQICTDKRNATDSLDIYSGFESIILEKEKYLRGIQPEEVGVFPKINLKKWSILVFQECFFSKMHALNNFMVDAIVEYCKELTRGKKLVIVVNFLHEFNDNDRPYWLLYYKQSEDCFLKHRIMIDENTPLLFPYYHQLLGVAYESEDIVYTPLFVSGEQRPQDFKLHGGNRLVNYSLVIANGDPIAIYRKTFYVEEKNPLIDRGHVYEFGDMKVHKIPRMPRSPFFEVLFEAQDSACRIFICGDLNIGIHPKKDNIFIENVSKLSIIESNSIPISSSQTLSNPNLRSVFSENGLIIHSDSRFGPFVGFLKENHIFAYVPYAINLKFENNELSKCDNKYPLMGAYNRMHTGIWGCSLWRKMLYN